MKFAIVFAALFALAVAAPATPNLGGVTILRSESEVGAESHSYAVETSDGVSSNSQGHLENAGTDHESYVHKGSYQFVGPDGVTYAVTYVADENGFQPSGAHLPVAPVALH
ncbi:hypothetical protein ACFFRR_007962 [Megaselia abdita]